MNIAVVIPVYKSNINSEEIMSLQQCFRVLFQHDIFIIYPQHLPIQLYKQQASAFHIEEKVRFVAHPETSFSSINAYNKLMLSHSFYNYFKDYNYILLYQLDAFIFYDDLINWCKKGYDYVGAPWINNYWSDFYSKHLTSTRTLAFKFGFNKFNLVGNGGLSLRKVSSSIFNLRLFKKRALQFNYNEDYFFSFFINSYNPFYKIPKAEEALSFAFDDHPELAYQLNNNQLPMGCHAWGKNKHFWKNYISSKED